MSTSGLDGRKAVIRTQHARDDAVSYCREYEHNVTPECIAGELAAPLSDEIHGDCKTGRFVNFYGEEHQFLGPRKSPPTDGENSPGYDIKNLATGKIADGSSGSLYAVNLGIYWKLCPATAPRDHDHN